MANRGMDGLNAVFIARSIVYDLGSAIGTYGEDLLSGLTGLPISELSRSEGKIERISHIAGKIEGKLKGLVSEGFVGKGGSGLTKKALREIAEETLKDELQTLSKLGFGSHPADFKGDEERTERAYPRANSDSYRRISPRKTVSVAARRGHKKILKEDLRSVEMTRRTGIDFVFVLDSSGSMKGDKMDACKRAAIGLSAISVGTLDRVAVVSFRKEPEVVCEFSDSEDVSYFSEKIVSLFPGGMTSIGKAITLAGRLLSSLESSKSAKHILLITDGLPTEGEKPVDEAKEAVVSARSGGITVSVAGIGLNEEGEGLLREIAGFGDGNFYNVLASSGDSLTGIALEDRERGRSA